MPSECRHKVQGGLLVNVRNFRKLTRPKDNNVQSLVSATNRCCMLLSVNRQSTCSAVVERCAREVHMWSAKHRRGIHHRTTVNRGMQRSFCQMDHMNSAPQVVRCDPSGLPEANQPKSAGKDEAEFCAVDLILSRTSPTAKECLNHHCARKQLTTVCSPAAGTAVLWQQGPTGRHSAP
jgi:hypothetical protein